MKPKTFYSLVVVKPDGTEEQVYGTFVKARAEAQKRSLEYSSIINSGRERTDLKIVEFNRREEDNG